MTWPRSPYVLSHYVLLDEYLWQRRDEDPARVAWEWLWLTREVVERECGS